MILSVLLGSAAAISAPVALSCAFDGDVVVASKDLRTGTVAVTDIPPEQFLYNDFKFVFEGENVAVTAKKNGELIIMKAMVYRSRNYLSFTLQSKTGWSPPETFWSYEFNVEKPRFMASFPSVSLNETHLMSGATLRVGEATSAVANLVCERTPS